MIAVEVVYCPRPGEVDTSALTLPEGTRIRDALAASGIAARHGLTLEALSCGIWGRRLGLDHPVRDRDRVEVYRPLQCDPKEARRLRYRQRKEREATAAAPVSGTPKP
jgi:hypothetical protein